MPAAIIFPQITSAYTPIHMHVHTHVCIHVQDKYQKMAKALKILLVDDDEIDRELFRTALEQVAENWHLEEAQHGEAALNFLLAQQDLPHFIILDLNMPVKDGRETLKELKSHPLLKVIPVCIMSTSSAHFDIVNAYDNGANFFIMKPFGFRELQEMLGSLVGLYQKYIFLPSDLKNREKSA